MKKKYILLLLTLVFTLAFGSVAFASSLVGESNIPDCATYLSDKGYDVSAYPYYVIIQGSSFDGYCYLFSKNPMCYLQRSELLEDKSDCDETYVHYYCNPSGVDRSTIYVTYENNTGEYKITNANVGIAHYSKYTPLYLNYDMKHLNTSEVSFRESSSNQGRTIGGLTTIQMIQPIVTELKMILPILMIVMVSYLALRKALAVLLNRLRTA